MAQLIPIKLDDGTEIYIEAVEGVAAPAIATESEEVTRGGAKGGLFTNPSGQVVAQSFQAIESTIRAYTLYTLNAFRQMAIADVKQVTLEFGVNVSGMTGIPYIATGTAGCNIKITVECAFPQQKPESTSTNL